jgi:hypothetical protein
VAWKPAEAKKIAGSHRHAIRRALLQILIRGQFGSPREQSKYFGVLGEIGPTVGVKRRLSGRCHLARRNLARLPCDRFYASLMVVVTQIIKPLQMRKQLQEQKGEKGQERQLVA